MQKVFFQDLGSVDYKKAWDYQEQLSKTAIEIKIANRKHPEQIQKETTNHLIFCEHPNVFTLGKSGSFDNLLVDEEGLETLDATFYKINRGGDITYHGPGQIVGYPILDLEKFFTDIHKYLRYLEEAIILTIAEYGIIGSRFDGYTGVWIEAENPIKARKICAMGVRCSRWITMHGFALNVNTNLDYFENIVPCGIQGKDVTSLKKELGREVDLQQVKHKIKNHLTNLFEMQIIESEKTI